MRRIALGSLLAASLALPALAQQPGTEWGGPSNQSSLALIAPTAPTAANNNQIATTAWVNNLVNAGLPLAAGKIWIGSVGSVATPQTPSGDLTMSNAGVFTLGTVNSNVGSFGSATQCAAVTVNAKGLITAASAATCTPAVGSITGLAANVATWLGAPSSANLRAAITDETGTGLAYFQGGDIGTPSAGVGSNLTALNASNLSSGTLPAARTNGHMNGEPGAGSAAAGEVGEFISATVLAGAAISNTTATAANVTSISLTAGDWQVYGNVVFAPNAATVPTVLGCWISVTSATVPTAPNEGAEFFQQLSFTTGVTQFFPCGQKRISVSGTTTVFLSSFATFTVNTMQSYGFIGARRAR